MRGLSANITRAIPTSAILKCDDNSGARKLKVIGVKHIKGVRGRYPAGGVASVVIASVRSGKPDMVKKVVRAVIIRQKKEYRRANGMRISFEDNAAALINDDGTPVATEIKGVVAREVAERFPKVAAITSSVM